MSRLRPFQKVVFESASCLSSVQRASVSRCRRRLIHGGGLQPVPLHRPVSLRQASRQKVTASRPASTDTLRSGQLDRQVMVPVILGLGAKAEDVARLPLVSEGLRGDPTLPFRLTQDGRFCIEMDVRTLRRLEFQPFTLTVEENFKRYDSGEMRSFDEIQDDLQLNSAAQALFAFKALLLHGVTTAQRPGLEYDKNRWICTLFSTRTMTPTMVGEPALEGVHSDGVDHTMTTFLGSSNMAAQSAATFLHAMAETTGIPLREASSQHILGRVRHGKLLDTLVIADHERKHSLSALEAVDKTRMATRDMLVFTRRPATGSHASAAIDSLVPHRGMPMEIPIFLSEGAERGDRG